MPTRLCLHTVIPVLVVIVAIVSEYSGLDLWLAGHFYDSASRSWPYRDRFLTSTLLHTGGKYLVAFIALTNILAILGSFVAKPLAPYRKDFIYILVAALTGIAVVAALKDLTHIYVPWDLRIFGGDRPYVRLFDAPVAGEPVGHGFPGGHSSGGFGYLSLYFALMLHGHRYRYRALALALALGVSFSIAQQLRGAHFLSHDMFSFVVCWTSALLWALAFYPRQWFWAKGRNKGPETNGEHSR